MFICVSFPGIYSSRFLLESWYLFVGTLFSLRLALCDVSCKDVLPSLPLLFLTLVMQFCSSGSFDFNVAEFLSLASSLLVIFRKAVASPRL